MVATPLSMLPSSLQEIKDKLGDLSLVAASIGIDFSTGKIVIPGISFIIGMPNLNWTIWQDKLAAKDIYCSFDIRDPLNQNTACQSSAPAMQRTRAAVYYWPA